MDMLADLRERIAGSLPDDYPAKLQAQRVLEESLNLKPAEDEPVAMQCYQTGIDDKALDWQCMALYESFGIQKTLTDRIARIRKEIKHHLQHGIKCNCLHMSWWLQSMLELVERHRDLTNWIEKHAGATFVCFSTDPSDLDSYGYPYDADGKRALAQCFYSKSFADGWLKQHEMVKASSFDDPTMWEYAPGYPGSYRHYVAFATKTDAEQFLLGCLSTPLKVWKNEV